MLYVKHKYASGLSRFKDGQTLAEVKQCCG